MSAARAVPRLPTLATFAAVCALGAIVLAAGRQARRIPATPAWGDDARAEGLVTDGVVREQSEVARP